MVETELVLVVFASQLYTLPQVTPMQISAGYKKISAGLYESQPAISRAKGLR